MHTPLYPIPPPLPDRSSIPRFPLLDLRSFVVSSIRLIRRGLDSPSVLSLPPIFDRMISWALRFSFVLKRNKRMMYTGRYLLDTRFRILGTVVNNKHGFVSSVGAFSVISGCERSGRDDWAIRVDHMIRRTAGRH